MNRSKAVTTKQALMADQSSFLSSPTKFPISSFLNSPRFFNGFFETENTTAMMSPTSILDSVKNSNFVNPFGYDKKLLKSPEITYNNSEDPKPIGLALIESINEPTNKAETVVFKSKLKVQIPAMNPPSSSLVESPKSPADFGIRTRNSQVLSPFSNSPPPTKDFRRQLSLKEMELSEDYTCVIIYGPNPKKTHIYDNCILENCSGDVDVVDDDKINEPNVVKTQESLTFLSYCHTCKHILQQGKGIYMYRGEKAFCSEECRCQEMFFEGMKNPTEMD